jgi:hypothetical protein
MFVVSGGEAVDIGITVEAERQQFVDAGVAPENGMSLIYNGRRFVISSMPGLNSDPTTYRMVCECPQRGKAR